MKFVLLLLLAAAWASNALAAEGPVPKLLPKVNSLPLALSKDFEFRKTKLFWLGEPRKPRKNSFSTTNPGIAEASMNFESTYRMYGAITEADKQQRMGNYFDFFWRAKRPANLTVRLEYRQDKLRSFVQAREVTYKNAKGNFKTEFAVIGDDYANDGRVIAWRCLLIENGKIVAQNLSYLWE